MFLEGITIKRFIFGSVFIVMVLFLPASFPAGASSQGPSDVAAANGVRVSGCVKNESVVSYDELSKLPPRQGRFKVAGGSDEYLGSFECIGADISEVLNRASIVKKTDDGYNREIDMYAVVSGRGGRKAVYSYGELLLAKAGGGFLLSAMTRPIYPHKHFDLLLMDFSPEKWMKASGRTDLSSCAACHNAVMKSAVYIPKGACLFAVSDGDRRFVEDVYEISIRQAPVPLDPSVVKKRKGGMMFVESPKIILPDGKTVEVNVGVTGGLERSEISENTVGLGKGFHGAHRYSGTPLSAILKKIMGGEADPANFLAVVTAADGYRCLVSGGEAFYGDGGRGVLLVDSEDGRPLGDDEGKYKLYFHGDFFVDRCIRSVAKIECFYVK